MTPAVQRWRERRASFRDASEVIDPRAFEVAEIADDATPRAFVEQHHYSASYPAARFRFGLYEHGALVGVAVFSHPSNVLALRPLPMSTESVELGRFVLLDHVKGNGETWFLARSFEVLRRKGLAGVVSFSDPVPRATVDGHVVLRGHVGTIYQAFNGVYLGRARADTMRLLPDGRTLHNRAVAKIRKREQGWRYAVAKLVAYGAPAPGADLDAWLAEWLPRLTRKVRHGGNHKYVWAFSRARRKSLPASAPYPKQVDGRLAA